MLYYIIRILDYYIYIYSITSASGPSAMIVPLTHRDRTAYNYLVSRLWFVKAFPSDIFTAIDEFLGCHEPLFPRSVRRYWKIVSEDIRGTKIYKEPHHPERLQALRMPIKALKGCNFCLDWWCIWCLYY